MFLTVVTASEVGKQANREVTSFKTLVCSVSKLRVLVLTAKSWELMLLTTGLRADAFLVGLGEAVDTWSV